MLYDLFASTRSLIQSVLADTLPPTAAELRAVRALRLKRVTGRRRVRPAARPAQDWARLTCAQLDTEMRKRKIKGRSKARRKADKIALLVSAQL